MPVRIEGNEVREMFSAIAPTYDRLNRLLSLGVDRRWRRAAAGALLRAREGRGEGERGRFLDLAAGTGDVALEIRRQLGGRTGVRLLGADFSLPMLLLGRGKAAASGRAVDFLQADALALPFPAGAFDGVIIAFGLRNLEDRAAGLAEMARVLRPGGRLAVLEFGRPGGLFGLLFRLYFRILLPAAGRLVSGHPTAYRYLPGTVQDFPGAGALSAMMREAGFEEVEVRPMTGGIALLHAGVRRG
ncbi:MAG: ubiquinone/menaquinone biosynthesis methyltransferase [bacterium]